MLRFENKLILIVGVSSGIGLATAQRLAQDGARIVGVGRSADRLQCALSTLEGAGHHAIVADIADESQLGSIITFGKDHGGYHGGVCCAGLHEIRPFSLLKAENLLASFSANVLTAVNTTKALAKAASSDGAGIVWLSSVAALRGTAGFTAYASSKGALVSAARVAAVELAKKKIRINVVVAGVVETPMSDGWLKLLSQEQQDDIAAEHLLGIGQPDDVADAIAFLVSSDARWMTGTTLVVDGGLSAH
jgi:NAD(P)-dependent dehydrogenase (short-subunit alcohol dehydrogenase family)